MKSHISDIGFFDEYLKGKGIAESTRSGYCGTVSRFLKSDPDIDDAEPYIDFLVKSSIKKRGYSFQYALKHYIRFKLSDNKKLAVDIIEKIDDRNIKMKDPVKYKDVKRLTDDEIVSIIGNLKNEKHRIMGYIMFETGLRCGDVLRISREGFFWENYNGSLDEYRGKKILGLNLISKGDRVRTVWIANESVAQVVYDFVTSHDYDTDFVFIEARKRPRGIMNLSTEYHLRDYNYKLFWEDIKQSMLELNIDKNRFSTHGFRRNFAKKEWDLSKDLTALKDMMGHRDVNTTLRYLKSYGEDTKDRFLKLQLGK
jgi:integrase